jgi:hypothetical protein
MCFVCGSVAERVLKLFKILGDIVPLRISYHQGVKKTDKHNYSDLIWLTECSSCTIQKLPFGVNTMIELENVIATSDKTCLVCRNVPR